MTAERSARAIDDIPAYCLDLAVRARAAGRRLARLSGQRRDAALLAIADRLIAAESAILKANALDLAAARQAGLAQPMIERLTLDGSRIAKMAEGVRQIAAQIDPVGRIIEGSVLPNGLKLSKVRVPIGVVLFIYESRPNVTSDAAALCIKSGNAIILRGGKEAAHSNQALVTVIRDAMAEAGLDPDVVGFVATPDRAAVGELLKLEGRIDVVIPRGGESLIRAVTAQSRIPVIKHYTGNCHIYVDRRCDHDMAEAICINAKTQRPSVCNAVETILVHREHAETGLLARLCQGLSDAGVEIRGDERTLNAFPQARAATEADWDTEYLDLVVAMAVVDDFDAAVEHINAHGSCHTDAIVTSDYEAAEHFIRDVDSADVFVNCSTRFSDGGEYGLGAEIGISTDRLHARGPMGAMDLTTYKWVVRGNGQIRT
ncbi:MAG: glutamate-5-semialdehyde dehydrogenase [Phycisphaeraceae bacterium]|nr:glutamate-5-semialdehyde dehydrogenase [Phycisphaeraceae bacterium]